MPAKDNETPARQSIAVNPNCKPDPANVHTWLSLVGDRADMKGTKVMHGCLPPVFQGHVNSAAAFASAKMRVGLAADAAPWTLGAARAEVLLPIGADDRLSDPRTLMQTVDAELPLKAKALLAYFTFTFPTPRIHEQYELVRDFTRRCIVDTFEVGALIVSHAPHRAARAQLPHVHVMVPGPRRLTALGLGEWVWPLADKRAHALVRNAFLEVQAGWRRDGLQSHPNGTAAS